jgi:uncharacterized protein
LLGGSLSLFLCIYAFAQVAVPPLRAPVTDLTQTLTPEQINALEVRIRAFEQRKGSQIAILLIPTTEPETIEQFAIRVAESWQLGRRGVDDGVLLLVAPNEKKVRIETGYGARVFLTDAVSSVIIRESILPRFREGDFGGGITAGSDQIIKMMSLSPQEAQRQAGAARQREKARDESGSGLIPAVFGLMIAVFGLLSMFRRASGRRYRSRRGGGGVDPWIVLWGLNELSQASRRGRGGWGGGGGFGGFGGGGGGGFGGFSGGGGSFGGGGASGGW